MDLPDERTPPPSGERNVTISERKTVETLDALMTFVGELNNAVAPVIGDLAHIPNIPLFLLPSIEIHGPAPLPDVYAALTSLGADSAAVLLSLQEGGLLACEKGASETEPECEYVSLTPAGRALIRRAAEVFGEQLQHSGPTLERIAQSIHG